ncbi:NACHT domain-containing protein [Streptomyces niveus]|uniref:NACHT domain-containing protein n=1 Tax=Streptomyces niveus TaxID=193462 RepID=UPI0036923A25
MNEVELTQLRVRLRNGIAQSGLTKEQLRARSGLSRTTIYEALRDGAKAPSPVTVVRLARALRFTNEQQEELLGQLRRATTVERPSAAGGKPHDSAWLQDYLNAAAGAARRHPYAGVLPDRTPPPLPSVYLSPWVEDNTGPSGASTAVRRLAHEAIDGMSNCLLIGEPGAGKTSWLRMTVRALSERLARSTHPRGPFPVYVRAAALVSEAVSFPEALARAINLDLGGSLLSPVSAHHLRKHPHDGAYWLILVDGLDELADAPRRQSLLETLKLVQTRADQESSPLYRFVVASRPLVGRELSRFARFSDGGTFRLLPFRQGQIKVLAETWFRADLLPDPEGMARTLMAKISGSHLLELAGSPLIATMICQIFTTSPEKSLPKGRYGLYEEFNRLARQQALTNSSSISNEFHPPDQIHAITQIPSALFGILPPVAAAMVTGKSNAMLETVLEHLSPLAPTEMPNHLWAEQVTAAMRRSGLLVQQGTEFMFLHHTIAEFLAARHKASADLAEVETYGRNLRNRAGAFWSRPDYSYDRFLIATWLASPAHSHEITKTLQQVAGETNLDSAGFLAALAADGIPLAPSTLVPAVEFLVTQATDSQLAPYQRLLAAKYLGALGREDVAKEVLFAITDDPASESMSEEYIRVPAAVALAELGDPRGCDALVALATSPGTSARHYEYPGNHPRLQAAWALAQLGDTRETDVLFALATRSRFKGVCRLVAARALRESGDARCADALFSLIDHASHVADSTAIKAASDLCDIGDPRGTAALTAFAAGDRTPELSIRVQAAAALVHRDESWTGFLRSVAADTNASDDDRRDAAEGLIGVDDVEATALLQRIVSDVRISGECRRFAREALKRLTSAAE